MIIQTNCDEASIRESLDRLRQAEGDSHVLRIMPGKGRISQPIQLDARDKGLTIEGSGDTVLSGGISICDWRDYGEGLICADLPQNADFTMLLVNGNMAEMACYPVEGRLNNLDTCLTLWRNSCNGGWNRPLNDYELTHMTVKPEDIPAGFEPRNAIVTHYHQWDESTVRVQDYDAGTGRFTFASKMEHPAGAFRQHSYVIRNIREGLTHPGQWMCDHVNQLLVYWPKPEDGKDICATFPLIESIFVLSSGADQVTFRNLTLTLGNGGRMTPGLRAVNEPGLIQADYVRDTVFDGIRFEESAGSAVRLYRSSGYRFENCTVRRVGAGGVVALESCEAQILNNCFEEIGLLCSSANPILAGGYSELVYVQLGSRQEVGKTVISGNRIRTAPYCGIVCCGEGHEIIGNDVSDTMRVLHDGAGIYVSRGHGMRVSDNVVVAPVGNGVTQAHAIYLDELSWDCVVEGNTMVGSVPFLGHLACRNTLKDNTIKNQGSLALLFSGCKDFTICGNNIEADGTVKMAGLPRESFADNQIVSRTNQIEYQDARTGFQFFVHDNELQAVDTTLPERAKNWKRILFLGDSITVAGWYLVFLQLYCSCRFPDREIEILNGGISGQRASDALLRLDTDVIARHPDVVIVSFGINDIERSLYAERTDDPEILKQREDALQVYEQSMAEIYSRLKAAGIEIMAMTPCAYDEYGAQEEENLTVCNSLGVTSLVERLWCGSWNAGVPIIDTFMPTSRLYQEHPELKITNDRVHPDKRGHLLIASVIAQSLFPEPADGKGLPFPIPEECRSLEPYVSLDAFSQIGKSAKGLDPRGLLEALEAWLKAECYSRSFIQVDCFLKKLGYNPAELHQEVIPELLEKVAKKYSQYYRDLLSNYFANRHQKDSLQVEADRLKNSYFEKLHALRKEAGI